MEKKICTRCKIELSIDNFGKDKNRKDGLYPQCKKCKNINGKKYYNDNKEMVNLKHKEYYQNNIESITEHHKEYAENNSDKIKLTAFNNRNNPESKRKLSVYQKQHRTENGEKVRKGERDYYDRNKESKAIWGRQYRKNNVEKIKIASRNYTINNRDKSNIKTLLRKSKIKKLPSTFTKEQWELVKKYFNNSCAYCGEIKPLEQEHFIALNKSGEYTSNNIICACRFCNCSKSDNDFFKWYPKQPFYNKEREEKIFKFLNYEGEKQQLTFTF